MPRDPEKSGGVSRLTLLVGGLVGVTLLWVCGIVWFMSAARSGPHSHDGHGGAGTGAGGAADARHDDADHKAHLERFYHSATPTSRYHQVKDALAPGATVTTATASAAPVPPSPPAGPHSGVPDPAPESKPVITTAPVGTAGFVVPPFHGAAFVGDLSDERVLTRIRARDFDPARSPYYVTYSRESYPRLANTLVIMPTPRSTHRGVISLKLAGSTVLFADPRLTPYLPAHQRQLPNPQLKIVAGPPGESCEVACGLTRGTAPAASPVASPPPATGPGSLAAAAVSPVPPVSYVCDDTQFAWLNACSVLTKHFPCERGCWGGVQGEDIPNYVHSNSKPEYYQHCLTTDGPSLCGAKHPTTSRLCPCVPR